MPWMEDLQGRFIARDVIGTGLVPEYLFYPLSSNGSIKKLPTSLQTLTIDYHFR